MALPTSDFTTAVHHDSYAAIAPTRPELSQAGRNVLITGGGTSIGKSIAKNFSIAAAKTVIIVGRRGAVLQGAVAELQEFATSIGSPTRFVSHACDVSNNDEVVALWDGFAAQKLDIDVLVLNAAMFAEVALLHELGIDKVWQEFETNVKGPLHFAEKFRKQASFDNGHQKVLIHVTTAAIHLQQDSLVLARPSYSVTKASATHAVQMMAGSVKPEQMLVISFHPGMIYTDAWKAFGITEDMVPFDQVDLSGAFSVWSSSKEAHFLHGRYVMANWDVTELSKGVTKKSLEENPDYLRLNIIGLQGLNRA